MTSGKNNSGDLPSGGKQQQQQAFRPIRARTRTGRTVLDEKDDTSHLSDARRCKEGGHPYAKLKK